MTKVCKICGKKGVLVRKKVKLRGKYNPTIEKRKKPNLQWFHLSPNKRILACAKCIKSMARSKVK